MIFDLDYIIHIIFSYTVNFFIIQNLGQILHFNVIRLSIDWNLNYCEIYYLEVNWAIYWFDGVIQWCYKCQVAKNNLSLSLFINDVYFNNYLKHAFQIQTMGSVIPYDFDSSLYYHNLAIFFGRDSKSYCYTQIIKCCLLFKNLILQFNLEKENIYFSWERPFCFCEDPFDSVCNTLLFDLVVALIFL